MQFSLLQENLNTALSHVSRFTSSRAQLPVLSHILFSTDNGRLKLSATNLELGINYWLGAKIEKEGTFAVPAQELVEYISYLPAGKLDFSLSDNNQLSIISPTTQSTFACSDPQDFPTIPSPDLNKTVSFDPTLLTRTLEQSLFAISTDDSRPVLTSALWKLTSDSFTMVATDGFRLSHKLVTFPAPITLPSGEDLTFLVPGKGLSEVAKLAKTASTLRFGLTPDGSQLVFVSDHLEIATRLLEGEFPDYGRIMPSDFKTTVTFDRDELAQAVKIASVFARQSANVVRFKIMETKVEISANAPQVGRQLTSVAAKLEGEPLEIAFNYKFINDFLSTCPGPNVSLQLNEPLSPSRFVDNTDPAYTHIIMPVRLQD